MQEMTDGTIFRLAFVNENYPKDAPKISIAHLHPTEKDIADAKVTGRVLVSVFDADATTVPQALVIRNQPSPATEYYFLVDKVRAIGNEEWRQVFQVFRHSLAHPACDLPGANGHCGIDGLHRESAPMAVHDFKQFRAELVALSEKLRPLS